MRNILVRFFIVFFVLLSLPLQAEQFQRFDDYEVHYILFNTQFLQPGIASKYGIERSKNTALVNVSVLKMNPDGTGVPVEAVVSGAAKNLMQQQKNLKFRTIKEQNAIYSLADLFISDREVLRFELIVKPEDTNKSYTIQFNQMTYIDRN